jgi:hypothetical protein
MLGNFAALSPAVFCPHAFPAGLFPFPLAIHKLDDEAMNTQF